MKKSFSEIKTIYSGIFAQPDVQINGGGDFCKVIIIDYFEDGSNEERIIYVGDKYKEKEV